MAQVAPPAAGTPPDQEVLSDKLRPRLSGRRLVLIVAAVLGASLAFALWRSTSDSEPQLTAADVGRTVERRLEQEQEAERNTPPDAAAAYRAITPLLVTVTTERLSTDPAAPRTQLSPGLAPE